MEAEQQIPKVERTLKERLLEGSRSCCRVAVAIPECSAVAIAGDEGVIRVYDKDGEQLRRIEAHNGRIMGLVSIGGGVVLSAGGNDGALRAWALQDSRRPLDSISAPDPDGCSALFAFEPSCVLVGTCGGNIVLYEWDVTARRFKALGHVPKAHGKRINTIHGHGGSFVTASNDATVAVWSRDAFERQKVFQFESRVFSAAISEKYIAAGQENYVHLYHNNRAKGFERAGYVRVPCGVIWSLKFSVRQLLMVCGDGNMNFVHTERRQLLRRVGTDAINIIDADFLPNGDVVLAGNGRDSNLIASIPRDLALIADDVPSQVIIGPRAVPARTHDGSRDPRRRGHESNPDNSDYNHDGRRSYGERDERSSYERYKERDREWEREREREPPNTSRRRGNDIRMSGYSNYDVNFTYDEDRRRREGRRDNGRFDDEDNRRRYGDHDYGRDVRNRRSPPRHARDYAPRGKYMPLNGDRDRNERMSNGRPSNGNSNGNGLLSRSRNGDGEGKSSDSKDELPGEDSQSNRASTSLKQPNVPKKAKVEPTVVGETSADGESNNVVAGNSNASEGVDTSSKRNRINGTGTQGAGESRTNSTAVAEERSETGTGTLQNDLAASKISMWHEKGLSKQVVAGLETEEIAEAMAAFMLRYRLTWKNKFDSLRLCLLKFLDDNYMTADDLVGKHAIPQGELSDSIIVAMTMDPNVGAKMGLLSAVPRFIASIRETST